MKLGRTALLILGIGIFVIAFGSLYMLYSRERNEQERLNDSLSVAQATLPKLTSEREDLESQLAQATSLLNAARSSFPDSVDSIKVDEELFKIAKGRNVEIIRLASSPPTDKEVESVTYSIALFMMNVEGEVADILNFINTIATDEDFINATVELVNMKVPEPLTEEEKEGFTEEEIEEKEKPSATIQLVIYSYQGEGE